MDRRDNKRMKLTMPVEVEARSLSTLVDGQAHCQYRVGWLTNE